jgi:hypothetical protein
MGAWGPAITSDDTVVDIIDTFKDSLKKTQSFSDARLDVENEYAGVKSDEEEQHLFWISLAEVQWKYGVLDSDILDKVNYIIENEIGLELWREGGENDLAKRKIVLDSFRIKVNKSNPKPLKIPKLKKKKLLFHGGECLSIKRPNESFIAGIVKRVNTENVEYPGYLIQILDWRGNKSPNEDVFRQSGDLVVDDFLRKGKKRKASAWFGNTGYQKFKVNIDIVCTDCDLMAPSADSDTYSPWELIDSDFQDIERST